MSNQPPNPGPHPGTSARPDHAAPVTARRYPDDRRPARSASPRQAVLTFVGLGLLVCGALILGMIQSSTGTDGLLVGAALAILPVPLVVSAFLWIDRVEPEPLSHLVFAFAWGACAATLISLLVNTTATSLLALGHGHAAADLVGLVGVAPVVEEATKAGAVALLAMARRREFDGVVDGIVVGGLSAAGFAFTENVLYFGQTWATDPGTALGDVVLVFILRGVMSPFAHPLFTVMTGIGVGLAVSSARRGVRVLAPVGGYLVAVAVHAVWNWSTLLGTDFLVVYALFMAPLFAGAITLVSWSRRSEIAVLDRRLPAYAAAGWISRGELPMLTSMPARRRARRAARSSLGPVGERAMREYQSYATELAFLREKANRGVAGADFSAAEEGLLSRLWERKQLLVPVLQRYRA